eukprot:1196083-Prorocentrum_minimum.AAC.2
MFTERSQSIFQYICNFGPRSNNVSCRAFTQAWSDFRAPHCTPWYQSVLLVSFRLHSEPTLGRVLCETDACVHHCVQIVARGRLAVLRQPKIALESKLV